MGYGIKFLSRTQLRQIITDTTDPVVKEFAEATLSTYEIHLSLEEMLIKSLNKESN